MAKKKTTEKKTTENIRRLGEFEDELPVPLTVKELAKKANELATADLDVKRLHEEKLLAYADWKQKIKVARDNAEELAKVVKSGAEKRTVKCEEIADVGNAKMFTRRLDTGVDFDIRDMTSHEVKNYSQENMFDEGEAA